jgi:hypothetical protein
VKEAIEREDEEDNGKSRNDPWAWTRLASMGGAGFAPLSEKDGLGAGTSDDREKPMAAAESIMSGQQLTDFENQYQRPMGPQFQCFGPPIGRRRTRSCSGDGARWAYARRWKENFVGI